MCYQLFLYHKSHTFNILLLECRKDTIWRHNHFMERLQFIRRDKIMHIYFFYLEGWILWKKVVLKLGNMEEEEEEGCWAVSVGWIADRSQCSAIVCSDGECFSKHEWHAVLFMQINPGCTRASEWRPRSKSCCRGTEPRRQTVKQWKR